MASLEMESDVDSLVLILTKLFVQQQESQKSEVRNTFQTKVINFKDKFSLNYVQVGKEGVYIEGLDDVFGVFDSEQNNSLIILSKHVNSSSQNGFNDSIESENTEDAFNSSTIEGTEKYSELEFSEHNQKKYCNQVIINPDEIINAGPSSSTTVQFITGKTQLQVAGPARMVENLKVDYLAPVALKNARYLVSIFVQAITKIKGKIDKGRFWGTALPWLLVKCAQKSPQHIQWICCNLENCSNDGERRGMLKSYMMKEETSVFDLQKAFTKKLASQGKVAAKSFYFSRYDILGSIFKKNINDNKESAMLLIEFAWQDKTAPNNPPPLSADALAKLRIVPSDPSSPLAPLYLELIQLENIVHNISTCVWPDADDMNAGRGDINELVFQFVEDLKSVKYIEESIPVEKETGNDDDNDDLAATLLAHVLDNFKRKDHDFSDNLWDFLRKIGTFDDVLLALDHIFTSICTREIQPVFNSENKTELALWIREFYKASSPNKGKEELQEKFDTILESHSKLFKLIADTGLEKYKRSYVSFFTNEELATFGQLEPILKYAVSSEEKMAMIWKLHHSLELVSFGKAYLHLSIDYLRILLKASLDYHKNMDAPTTSPIFSLSIPAVSPSAATLVEECRTMRPVMWKIASNRISNIPGNTLSSMFIVSKDNDLKPDIDANGFEEENMDVHKVLTIDESRVRVY